jgi:hypothetical protein
MYVVCHAEKANAQIGTFGFLPTHKQNTKNQKSLFFLPTLGRNSNETNEKYIEK